MGDGARGTERWRTARYGVALMGLLGAMLWLLQSPDAIEPKLEASRDAVTPPRAVHAAVALEHAGDGLPIRPAAAHVDAPEQPMHPHPHTPAHERIYRENNFVGALNLAVDLADPARIREVLARYRAEYPEDDHRLQEGYAIIADCLEQLDDATRERAEQFWNTEIRSQTRRYVRRYCLERG